MTCYFIIDSLNFGSSLEEDLIVPSSDISSQSSVSSGTVFPRTKRVKLSGNSIMLDSF
jgi:hypothetical protein